MVIIILTVIMGGFNFFATSKMNNDARNIINEQLPLLMIEEELAFNIAEQIAVTRAYVLYGDQQYRNKFDEYTEKSEILQEQLLVLQENDSNTMLVENTMNWRALSITEVFQVYDTGNIAQAQQNLKEEVQPLAEELMASLKKWSSEREQVINVAGQDVIANGDRMNLMGTIILAIVLLAGSTLAIMIARNIANPIQLVTTRMNVMEDGDMSHEYLQINTKDEIGHLAKKMNDLQYGLRDVVEKVSSATQNVASQSTQLTQFADEVKEGSEQIASTMQELSSGAESQANSASNLAEKMDGFKQKIESADQQGDHVVKISNEVLSVSEEGSKRMQQSVRQMGSIDQIVSDAVAKVKGLDNQSKEIVKLVVVIKDIAEQTNLLALNAAIEAARAGDHGKGFAVVADEVRKLAEQVQYSVGDITTIVNNIQQESNSVVDSLQTGYKEVDEGSKQIKKTEESFLQISNSLADMVTKIKGISGNLKEIVKTSDEMNNSIDEIASVSEESAAGIEQAAASAQQSSSSMEEVSKSAVHLAHLAEQLTTQVNRFKL